MRAGFLRVLMVDDLPARAQALAAQLLPRGAAEGECERVSALSELEATLDAAPWDVVLASSTAAALPPAVAAERVRSRGLDIPVIVLAGPAHEAAWQAARRAGADDCVSAQDARAVADAMERALRRHHARRARQRGAIEASARAFRTSLDWLQRVQVRDPAREGRTLDTAGAPEAAPEQPDAAERLLFTDRVRQAIAQSARSGRGLAVVVVGLGGFDPRAADARDTLRTVMDALHQVLRGGDTVARWTEDQLALLLPGITAPEDAARVATKALDSLRTTSRAGRPLALTWSAGIGLYPSDAQDPAALIQLAAAAVDAARAEGAGTPRLWAPALHARATERLAFEQGLQQALERSELVLHYQPILASPSGTIRGLEALLRWNHPQRGLVPAARIVPVLEDTGLIGPVGAWALRTACHQAARWLQHGGLRLAVNVSVRQLRDPGFPDQVASVLAEAGVAPSALELEVSEATLSDADDIAGAAFRLTQSGVGLALDDLGVGPSALGALRRLPVDALKVDCACLEDARTGPAFARALMAVGRELGLRVVAEGVETQDQLAFARAQGCDEVQGYALFRELPAAEVPAVLRVG